MVKIYFLYISLNLYFYKYNALKHQTSLDGPSTWRVFLNFTSKSRTHLCKCVCCSSFVKSIHAGNHLWGVGKFSYDCVSKQPLLRLYDYRRFERNSLEDERHSWLLLLHYRLTVILNYVCKIRISKCQEGAQWIGVIFTGAFHKGIFQSCFCFNPLLMHTVVIR